MITRLRHVVETLILLTSLTLLGGICLSWTLVALPLLLVLCPEWTRASRPPTTTLQAGVGMIAKEAGVSVETLIIETDSPCARKGWSLFRRRSMPIAYRVRLGRGLDPPVDVRAFIVQLDQY